MVKLKILALALGIFWVVGCVPENMPVDTTTTIVATNTLTIPFPTPSPTETITPTPKPTLVIPTATLYLTPFPTFSLEQSIAEFSRLYKSNNGCRLPCWLGITPGISTWTETRQFAEQFDSWGFGINKADVHITKSIPYETYAWPVDHPGDADYAPSVYLEVQNNIVVAILIDSEVASYSFPVHKLLNDYGQPNQLLIKTSKSPEIPSAYFVSVYVVYEDEYIQAAYDFVGDGSKNPVSVCLYNVQMQPMILWSSSQELNRSLSRLKSLDQYSDLDTQSFYERFNSNGNKCMYISNDAWP
jgi:hypothetical protein